MCPLPGVMKLLIIILILLILCHAVLVYSLKINFTPKNITIFMYDSAQVNFSITGENKNDRDFQIYIEDTNIVKFSHNSNKEIIIKNDNIFPIQGIFNISGHFIGVTKFKCKINKTNENIDGELPVIVTRKKRIIDTVFTASVATLVSIIYVNFGCAFNWYDLRTNLKKPIGILIGLFGQFIIMPLLSYFVGKFLFPNSPEMQLGMFFTGVSPSGGASNIWTCILDGNLDLSITMTAISTFIAFGMMPLWLFTLGTIIFDDGNIIVPYNHITIYAFALIIPLAIGYLIQHYFKTLAKYLVKILKSFSSFLIIFIILFAIFTNLYLFQLFSWQIIVAGILLPYIGFLFAYIIAKILRQSNPDILAIAIETSIQNTGIAIFLLRFTLPQPQADLTTVVPVAVAIMTPFPFMFMFIYKKFKATLLSSQMKLNEVKESSNNYNSEHINNNRITESITMIT